VVKVPGSTDGMQRSVHATEAKAGERRTKHARKQNGCGNLAKKIRKRNGFCQHIVNGDAIGFDNRESPQWHRLDADSISAISMWP
jgi:hypothetical protein